MNKMIGNFFYRNKIEENVAKHLIYGCSTHKNHKSIFCRLWYILKMDLKNVKISLNLALKRGTSQTFLKSLITSKPLKIISWNFLRLFATAAAGLQKTAKLKNCLFKFLTIKVDFFFKKSTVQIQAFKKQAKKVLFLILQ